MSDKKTIHLVMGVSSSGKSSYIESRIQRGDWSNLPVLMAHEINLESPQQLLGRETIVHYNLFRPFSNDIEYVNNGFLTDKVLVELLKHPEEIRAYVLVAHRSSLIKRVLLREGVEPKLKETTDTYPRQKIAELLFRLDMSEFYRHWFMLLNRHNISYEIINTERDNYIPVATAEDAYAILASDHKAYYSHQQIDYILATNRFEYQQIDVASGKVTAGQNRSETLQFLDDDLEGKSLLDIGCAYGFFCFEAERRRAARVVGTELKRHRFIGCNILKEIKGSNAEFLFRDIFNDPMNEQFDIVLFLNVIHHLAEPIKALRMAARSCKEKLIIEFPTLADEKFRSTMPDRTVIDPRLPLIGVSLLAAQDQTFLFSDEAVRRILMEHDKLFARVEFLQSPMAPERRIAICYK